MRSDHRLVEREAENNFESKKSHKLDEKEMITEFRINHTYSEPEIEYKNLDDDWDSICRLRNLKDTDIIQYMTDDKDLILSDKVQNELERLQKRFQNIFDTDLNMYELSYRVNDDDSAELYLPLQTDFTDDFVVKKIYNKDSEFVAHDIEENIDFPLYELESREFYVKTIANSKKTINVYSKKESTYDDILEDSYLASDESRDNFIKSSIVTICIYALIGTFYLLGGFELAGLIFLTLNLVFFAPISLPIHSTIYLYINIRTYIQYKNSDNFTANEEFKTEL